MNWHVLHETFFNTTYQLRNKYYAPLLQWLVKNRITANDITNIRIIFVLPIAYFLFINISLVWAAIFYMLFWLVDTIDGSLARYTHTESHKGKFFDGIVDNFMFAFVLIGIMYNDLVTPAILTYHIVAQLFVYVLAIIKKQENVQSDWIIYPQAEAFYHKLLVHSVLVIYIFFNVNFLEEWFIIHNTWLTFDAVRFYRAIQRTPYLKNTGA